MAALLGMLDDEAGELAGEVERVGSQDWSRTGRVADGGELGALDVVREAVRTASVDLAGVEAAMAAARRA